MKVRLVTAVWGEEYVDTFVRACLRSLLSPGNAADLSTNHDVVYTIFTRPEDARAIERTASFISLREAIRVELSEFGASSIDEANYGSHGTLWQQGIALAKRNNEIVIFIIPDAVYASGTLVDWVQRVANGARAVFTPGPQVALETALPELEARFPGSIPLALRPDEIYDLVFRHLHPLHAVMRSDSLRRPPHPEYDLRLVPDRGLIVREIVGHPFCLDPSYFQNLRHYGPQDRLDAVAFAPSSIIGLEPMLKRANGYYRPWPLDEVRLSNLGAWWEGFATPACEAESAIPFELCRKPDAQWVWGRQRSIAAGSFYRSQVILSGKVYRLFLELQNRGYHRSASIVAAAFHTARLRRNLGMRSGAILLVPTDRAFRGKDWERVQSALRVGQERDLQELLKRHIVFDNRAQARSPLQGESAQTAVVQDFVTAHGLPASNLLASLHLAGKPSYIEPFAIYPVDRILSAPDSAGQSFSNAGAYSVAEAILGSTGARDGTSPEGHLNVAARTIRAIRQGGIRVTARKVRTSLFGGLLLQERIWPLAVPDAAVKALAHLRNYRTLRCVQLVFETWESRMQGSQFRSAPLGLVNDLLKRHGLSNSEGNEAAERLLTNLTHQYPRWAEAWLEFAFLREDQEKLDGALDCFMRAMQGVSGSDRVSQNDPHPRAVAATNHGRLLHALGYEDRAAASFAFAVALDPYQRIAAVHHAKALRRQGDIDQSLMYFAEGMYYQECRWALPPAPRHVSNLDMSLLARGLIA